MTAPRHLAPRKAVQASALKALAHGGYVTMRGHVDHDASGRCLTPYLDQRISVAPPVPDGRGWRPGLPIPYSVRIAVPCRRCRACLQYRGWEWSVRAQSELKLARRTWFTTLTAPDDYHYQVLCAALSEKGRGFKNEQEEFVARSQVLGRDVTLFFKKLRNNTKVPFRYILVSEEHEKGNRRGLPHYHALIHETSERSITWRELRQAWAFIDEHKLVYSDGVAAYCTKYLTKTMKARVRASLGYGLGTARPSTT